MTKPGFGIAAACLFVLASTGAAFAQTADEPETGNGQQTEMMDGSDMDAGSDMDSGMEPADDGMDEARDPAAPQTGDTDGDMMEPEGSDMAEPGNETAPEDTGPSDMISDSSERALVEADVADLSCEELWIARNEIFDRNGYCFRSERGQAYFDNSDCSSDSQDILSELEWSNVDLIKSVEADKQCN